MEVRFDCQGILSVDRCAVPEAPEHFPKERQDRTGQNKQELKNRQNKQKQTKPYLQNKQLISACGSRAGQRMQEEGKYML